MTYTLNFHTAYNTFFISSDNCAAIETNWLGIQSINNDDRLLQAINLLGIQTASYGHIKGELLMLPHENKSFIYNNYDHIVEGGLKASSGIIDLFECPGLQKVFAIKAKPGSYRVRVYTIGISGTDIDEDEGKDNYKIEIWPDDNQEKKVLKQYNKL